MLTQEYVHAPLAIVAEASTEGAPPLPPNVTAAVVVLVRYAKPAREPEAVMTPPLVEVGTPETVEDARTR